MISVMKAECVVLDLQQLCVTNPTVVRPVTEIMMLYTSVTPVNLPTQVSGKGEQTLVNFTRSDLLLSQPVANVTLP